VDKIRKQVEELRTCLSDNGLQPRHHQTITVLTELSETWVQGKTYLLLTWYHTDTSELEIRASGMYDDEFIKTDAGWKFKKWLS
jgi:hypothetical protein